MKETSTYYWVFNSSEVCCILAERLRYMHMGFEVDVSTVMRLPVFFMVMENIRRE